MTGLVAAHPWRVLVAVMFSGALLGGTWYALATAAGGRDFLATQLWNEQLGRLMPMDNFEPGHRTPPYFSAVYLVVAALPWSAFLPQASIAAWRSRRQESREGLFVRFCAIWVLVFVVAVTASISRRSAYFVPALPAIAVLVSAGLRSSASEIPGWARWFSVTILALLAAAAAVAWTFLVGTVSYREGLARMVGERAMADAAVIAAAAPRMVEVLLGAAVVAWIVAVVRTSRRGRAVASTASAVVLTAMAAATVLPTVAQAYSPRRFMADVRAMVSDGPLVQLAPVAFEATFYAGRPVPVVPMDRLVAVDADLFVLVRLSDLPAVRAAVPSAIVLLQQTSRIALGNRQLTLLRIPQAVRSSLLH